MKKDTETAAGSWSMTFGEPGEPFDPTKRQLLHKPRRHSSPERELLAAFFVIVALATVCILLFGCSMNMAGALGFECGKESVVDLKTPPLYSNPR